MNEFKRTYTQVDIPTIEVVPEDEAERAAWQRRRELYQAAREQEKEEDRKRMENLRRFEAEMNRPHRKVMRWIERQLVVMVFRIARLAMLRR